MIVSFTPTHVLFAKTHRSRVQRLVCGVSGGRTGVDRVVWCSGRCVGVVGRCMGLVEGGVGRATAPLGKCPRQRPQARRRSPHNPLFQSAPSASSADHPSSIPGSPRSRGTPPESITHPARAGGGVKELTGRATSTMRDSTSAMVTGDCQWAGTRPAGGRLRRWLVIFLRRMPISTVGRPTG